MAAEQSLAISQALAALERVQPQVRGAMALKEVTEAISALRGLATAPCPTPAPAEVRMSDNARLDEVVGQGQFQLERMRRCCWFVMLGDVAVWLESDTRINATFERRDAPVHPLKDFRVLPGAADAGRDDREISLVGKSADWLKVRTQKHD